MRSKTALLLTSGLLLLVGVAILYWLHSGKKTAQDATTLLPADTFLLAEINNGSDLKDKLRQTALASLWREPDMQKLLGPFRKKWLGGLGQKSIAQPAPAGMSEEQFGMAFIALLPGREPGDYRPVLLAGVERRGEMETLKTGLSKFAKSLGFSLEVDKQPLRQHGQKVIYRAVLQEQAVEVCTVGNRFFLGSQPVAFDDMLDRLGKPAAADSLKESALLQNATKSLPVDWDVRFLLQTAAFPSSSPWKGGQVDSLTTWFSKMPAAMVVQSRVRGENFQDSIWLSGTQPNRWPVLTAARNGARKEEFLSVRMPLEAAFAAPAIESLPTGQVSSLEDVRSWLARFPISEDEWRQAFGPEVCLTAVWPENAGRPSFELLCDIRQPATAQELYRRAADDLIHRPNVTVRKSGDLDYLLIPTGESQLYRPAVTLQKNQLRLVSNFEDLPLFDLPLPPKIPSATLPNPTKSPGKEAGRLIFSLDLDTALLVDRSYRTARPMLLMALQFMPKKNAYFDFNHLPEVKTVTRHLGPTHLEVFSVNDGLLLESNGPLTLPQLALAGLLPTMLVTP